MRRHPEFDYSDNIFGIKRKDAEPLTDKELKTVQRLLRQVEVFDSKKDLEHKELIRKLKIYQWRARQMLLVREVLDASTATEGEKAFLSGEISIDPDPKHAVKFNSLTSSHEILHIPFNLDIDKPIFAKIRTVEPKRAGLEAVKHLFIPGRIPNDQVITFDKQVDFQLAFEEAVPMAVRASDGYTSEFEYLEADGRDKTPNSWLRVDPYSNHLIVYRRLIPQPIPAAEQTTVFQRSA